MNKHGIPNKSFRRYWQN